MEVDCISWFGLEVSLYEVLTFFLRRYISHASSASTKTPTPAPMPMPALAPALTDEVEDPLVFMGRRSGSVAVACWSAEGIFVDDTPVDDGILVLDDRSVVCISTSLLVKESSCMKSTDKP